MPLFNGKEIKFVPPPKDLKPSDKVFQIRFTKEIFRTFQEYSHRLDFYRNEQFSCKYSGKSGFSYENAVNHENQTKIRIKNEINPIYLPIIFKEIQFSQLKVTELVNIIFKKLNSEFNKQQNNNNQINDEEKEKENKLKPKPKPKKLKPILKKGVIRTQIRIVAKQDNYKNAAWILDDNIAKQYNINTKIPKNIQKIIDDHNIKLLNKNKPKIKKNKKKISKISAKDKQIQKMNTKQLKYPVDDQLLAVYNKYDNDELNKFNNYFKLLYKIGKNNDNGLNGNDNDTQSNLAFIDYNTTYDGGSDVKYRQLNDLFNSIWKLWSFISVFSSSINISPFPISFLMDGLLYDKRCILLDEIQIKFLEIIRKHCIHKIIQNLQNKKDEILKKKIKRKKQIKANKRAAKRKAKLKLRQKQQQQLISSDKQEMDATDDDDDDVDNAGVDADNGDDNDDNVDDGDDTDESGDNDDEDSDDDDDDDDSDEESSDSSSDSDIYITDDDDDIIDVTESDYYNTNNLAIFRNDPINGFRIDLIKDYLYYRCNNDNDDDKNEFDVDEDNDITMNDDNNNNNWKEKEEEIIFFSTCNYKLTDSIWNNLISIRNYYSLPIESKLEIFNILLRDVINTSVIKDVIQLRIQKSIEIKPEIKLLDDEYNNLIKTSKKQLKSIRNELYQKKKVLNPTKNKKKQKKAASSSSSAASSSSSRDVSNSPNKENNGSKANSNSTKQSKSTSLKTAFTKRLSLRQIDLKKKEISKLDELLKDKRNIMIQRSKLKEYEITNKKYKLLLKSRLYMKELGEDRYYNKYYWNMYADGRIFIYHPCNMYDNNNINNGANNNNNIRGYNQWELVDDDNKNRFCWSCISLTSEFYNLLNILDERGVRENGLLLHLNSLKDDIIKSMVLFGNDDYKNNDLINDNNNNTLNLRRSKRTTRTAQNDDLKIFTKGFLSYKNKFKNQK